MNFDLISRSGLKKALSQTPYNDYDDLTRTENLIDNAPAVEAEKVKEGELVKAYTKGFDTGVETVRSQGEWIDYSNTFYKCPDCGYLLEKCCPHCQNKVILPKGGAE